jgi:hypothetical protein
MLGNGLINTYLRQRICLQKYIRFLEAVLYMRSMPNSCKEVTNRIGSPQSGIKWSEDSQSRQKVKYGHEYRGTRNQGSLCWRQPAAIQQSSIHSFILSVSQSVIRHSIVYWNS